MEDDFLANSLALYIEREIAEHFDLYSILNDFVLLKDRKIWHSIWEARDLLDEGSSWHIGNRERTKI